MAKKKKKSRIWIIISIVAVLLILVIASVMKMSNRDDIAKVEVTKVEHRTIVQTVTAIGKIQPETEVKISSETSGELIFLAAKEGDTVRTGQILVRIKPDIIETQLEQQRASAEASKMDIDRAKAEMDRAKAQLARIKNLYDQEFASLEEYDRAKATYDQANSSYLASLSRYQQALAYLKQFERNAERTSIVSPINGIITSLSVEVGEKVVGTEMMAGTEMMRVSDLNVINAEVDVDENDIVSVSIGDEVDVEIDAFPERIFKGEVFEIGHSAIQSSAGTQDQVTNFQVKVRIMEVEAKLRPGMSCSVEIKTEIKEDVLAIPLLAVTVRDTTMDSNPDLNENGRGFRKVEEDSEDKKKKKRPPTVVFVRDNNIVLQRLVKTGISDNGFIEITSGLEAGEEVVSSPFKAIKDDLKDSSKIRIEKKSDKKKK
jgi:HlyD family secretion protein